MAERPPRLQYVFQEYDPPLWFVTFCTTRRKPLLANKAVHDQFRTFCTDAENSNIGVGRYVLMPDHVHLFVAGPREFALGRWVLILKLCLSRIPSGRPHWQEGFFDHLVRRSESYGQKWEYVRLNPVRAGLVKHPEDWLFQGEHTRLPFN